MLAERVSCPQDIATRELIMAERKIFANHLPPLPAADGMTTHGLMVAAAHPDQSKERMTILFSLAIPKNSEDELQQLVAQGKSLSPEEVAKKFSADSADQKALVSWLKSQGY